jgi:hypothetical protein
MPKQEKLDLTRDVIFKDFQNGIADSPHLGYAMMKNVDVTTTPGVAKINFKAKKMSGTGVTGFIKWFTKYERVGDFYGVDDAGKVYKVDSNGTTLTVMAGNTFPGGATVNAAGIIGDYFIIFRDTGADALGPLNGTPAWVNAFITWTSDYHTTYNSNAWLAQDNHLYWPSTAGLASLSVVDGKTFNPADSTTFTYNAAALRLPDIVVASCIAELGNLLMVGTFRGVGTQVGDIYPWTKNDPTYQEPVRLPESGVRQLITINNKLYAVGGSAIYISDSINYRKLKRLAKLATSDESQGPATLGTYPYAIASQKGSILIGTFPRYNTAPTGVWRLTHDDLLQTDVVTFFNQISTGNVNNVEIGAIYPIDDYQYLITWKDTNSGTVYGIDKVVTTERYTGYAASLETDLRPVGIPTGKRTFREIEFELGKPLATGQGVRISYRKNLTDAYTVLGTWDYSSIQAKAFVNDAAGKISDATYVQLKIELTTDSATYTTPELREVRLR